MSLRIILLICFILSLSLEITAQIPKTNYLEFRVPRYNLPDPLIFENGEKVKNIQDWEKRRVEILRLFEQEVYGISPEWEGTFSAKVIGENNHAFDGMGTLKEVKLTLNFEDRELDIYILFHLPNIDGPVPLFLGYNFFGNHTTTPDPMVYITDSFVRNNESFGITDNRATEESRGVRTYRWPAYEIISRGYGLATIYYGDVVPDFDDGFKNGVHGLMGLPHDSDSWGSIAAWAWGLSRVMDYLETNDQVDHDRVAVIGHSRLGKAALWAGASDERFAMVISNNSGCGGAALSLRRYGETVGRINRQFPHWFAENFSKYNENEQTLPVDQHQLLALIAPRPLYVASAKRDRWADPKGEFLACVKATPVYKLYGLKGITGNRMPRVERPVSEAIGYHIRKGRHDLLLYDWQQFLDFADKHLLIMNDIIVDQ